MVRIRAGEICSGRNNRKNLCFFRACTLHQLHKFNIIVESADTFFILYPTCTLSHPQAPAAKKSRTAKPAAAAAAPAVALAAAPAAAKKAPSAAVKKQAKAIAEKTFAALAVFAQASQLEKSAKDKLTETVSEHMVGNMHAVAAKTVEKKQQAAKKAKSAKKAVKSTATKSKAAPKSKSKAAPKKKTAAKKTIAKK